MGADSVKVGADSVNAGADSVNAGTDSVNAGIDSVNAGGGSNRLGLIPSSGGRFRTYPSTTNGLSDYTEARTSEILCKPMKEHNECLKSG